MMPLFSETTPRLPVWNKPRGIQSHLWLQRCARCECQRNFVLHSAKLLRQSRRCYHKQTMNANSIPKIEPEAANTAYLIWPTCIDSCLLVVDGYPVRFKELLFNQIAFDAHFEHPKRYLVKQKSSLKREVVTIS